jgi:cytosine/uracil/thiamine/allantoin permease
VGVVVVVIVMVKSCIVWDSDEYVGSICLVCLIGFWFGFRSQTNQLTNQPKIKCEFVLLLFMLFVVVRCCCLCCLFRLLLFVYFSFL